MTFPTTPISESNLDSSADDPSLARADLLQAVQTLNTIMDEAGQAYGVAILDSSAKIAQTQIPDSLSSTNQFTITAGNNIISLQSLIRIQSVAKAVLLGFTNMSVGDIVICSDADSGSPALAIYDGTDWKYLPMASFTTIS